MSFKVGDILGRNNLGIEGYKDEYIRKFKVKVIKVEEKGFIVPQVKVRVITTAEGFREVGFEFTIGDLNKFYLSSRDEEEEIL